MLGMLKVVIEQHLVKSFMVSIDRHIHLARGITSMKTSVWNIGVIVIELNNMP